MLTYDEAVAIYLGQAIKPLKEQPTINTFPIDRRLGPFSLSRFYFHTENDKNKEVQEIERGEIPQKEFDDAFVLFTGSNKVTSFIQAVDRGGRYRDRVKYEFTSPTFDLVRATDNQERTAELKEKQNKIENLEKEIKNLREQLDLERSTPKPSDSGINLELTISDKSDLKLHPVAQTGEITADDIKMWFAVRSKEECFQLFKALNDEYDEKLPYFNVKLPLFTEVGRVSVDSISIDIFDHNGGRVSQMLHWGELN